MAHEVTLITGDGVGPELAEAARRCVDATGVKINWDVQEAGVDVMARTGTPLPDADAGEHPPHALRPEGPDHHAGRHRLSQHQRPPAAGAGPVRLHPPCKYYPGVRTFFSDVPVDLVIVRENTEDLYAGIEFEAGKPATGELIDYINQHLAAAADQDRAATRPASRSSRSASPAPSGSSAAPSSTPATTAARRSRPSTRRTS